MKRTSPPSRRPFNATESSPDFLGPIAELQPPSFPSFPTVEQFLQHQAGTSLHPLLQLSETPPPSKPASLFQGMLGSLDALVQDAAAHPELYDEASRGLLAELATGARKLDALTPAEAAVLDRATIDFAAGRRPAPPAPRKTKAPAPAKKPRLVEAANEYELADGRAPQVEEPGGTMTPYWWLT